MNENKNWLNVTTPDKWMGGWNKYFEQEQKMTDEELMSYSAHYIIQQVSQFFPKPVEGKRYCETGAGSGQNAIFMAQQGFTVDASDANALAVKIAQRRAEITGLSDQCTFTVEDITKHNFKEETYDIIASIQSLQYTFDKAPILLRKMITAVKRGGYFLYSGNVKPHFETDPPLRFLVKEELLEILDGWTIIAIGNEERLIRQDDVRGYLWIIAQRPK